MPKVPEASSEERVIVTLTGNNSYQLRQRLDNLVSEFVKKYGQHSVQKIDAEDTELPAILDAVASQPFLSKRKMVVARDLSANKPAAEAIEQIISSISDSTDLILYEPLTDKRTAFYKTCKAKTQLEEHLELDVQELSKWLVSEAKSHGGSLRAEDAYYLVGRVGENQTLLSSELEKLLLYSKIISRENIDLLTEPTVQSKVFELLDAAFGGHKELALKLYDEQRTQKVEPQAILAMIAWQLRLISLAKYRGERSPAQVSKEASVNAYPMGKAINLAQKISEERLKNMVSEALDIDYRGKTTSLNMDEALKTYIVTL